MVILNQDEINIINFIGKFGYCTIHHLHKYFDIKFVTIEERVKRMVSKKIIQRIKYRTDKPSLLILSKEISKEFCYSFNNNLNVMFINHSLLLIDLYINFYNLNIYTDIEIDKDLSRFNGSYDKDKLPDIILNDYIAVEIELSQKSEARLEKIGWDYERDVKYKEVWYMSTELRLLKKIFSIFKSYNKFRYYLIDNDLYTLNQEINYIEVSIESLQTDNNFINNTVKFGAFEFN